MQTLKREGDADDPVGLYLQDIIREPLLTVREELELAERIASGKTVCEALENSPRLKPCQRAELEAAIRDVQAARKHLARANTRLVVSIAKRHRGYGLSLANLIQEGNLGLMRAVDKYDRKRGTRFSTYATYWIWQAVTRALSQKTRTIRIPLHISERIRLMYKAAGVLEQELSRRLTPEEIALRRGLSVESVHGMMHDSQHTIALERPLGDDGDGNFGDFIEDKNTSRPADAAEHRLLHEAIEGVLAELTPREARILRWRLGLGTAQGERLKLEQIANKFGLSRERIRQLEKVALARLRNPWLAGRLRDYYE